MNQKRRLRLTSFVFVSICLLIFASSLMLFWKDLNRSTVRSDKTSIGHIEYKYKVAQRKFSDRVAFERVQQNSPLYNGDTIRTADNAMARLILEKTVVNIQEHTTIQIFYSEETGLNLSGVEGNIQIDTTASEKDISVNFSNGQQLKMEPGSKLNAGSVVEGGTNNLIVHSGIVEVESADGEVIQLSSGDTVRLSESGGIQRVPVSITSITDNLHILNFDDSEKNILLEWKKSDSAASIPVVVETSKDKNFQTIENSYVVDEGNSLNLAVGEGKLYWKVYLQNQDDNSISGKIAVDKVTPVSVLSPLNEYKYEVSADTTDVTFNWKGNDYVSHYLLDVSTNPDFSDSVLSKQVSTTYFTYRGLSQGTYYWKVTPFYAVDQIGYEKASEIRNFAVNKLTSPKAPVLAVPSENARITLEDSGAELNFIWKTYSANQDYELKVATDKKFERVIYSSETSGNRFDKVFEPSEIGPGTYYWKVVSKNQKDKEGNILQSDIRSFVVQKYIPGENKLIYPPDNFSVESTKLSTIEFMWKVAREISDDNTESTIQIATDSDFNNITLSRKLKDTYVSNLRANSGNYWWRVAIAGTDGNTVYTRANRLHVLETLKAPVITAPAQDLLPVLTGNAVAIKWESVEGATSYSVKVFDEKEVYANTSVNGTETKVVVPAALFQENAVAGLRCSVQAVASQTDFSALRTGPVSEKAFSLRMPQKVELSAPADASRIAGLTARRSPVSFKWNSGSDASSTQFILKRMGADGGMQIVKKVSNAGSSCSVTDLGPGTYEWTVKAATKDGYEIDAENTFRFTITPIPQLGSARLVAPANTQVINSDYLSSNKAINFKWTAVSGATEYQFILYHKLPNGKLMQITSVRTKKTELKYTDLASLDIGHFQWQVLAYSYDNFGREEQRSRAAISDFSIDFGVPDEVETYAPGRMYGE